MDRKNYRFDKRGGVRRENGNFLGKSGSRNPVKSRGAEKRRFFSKEIRGIDLSSIILYIHTYVIKKIVIKILYNVKKKLRQKL